MRLKYEGNNTVYIEIEKPEKEEEWPWHYSENRGPVVLWM